MATGLTGRLSWAPRAAVLGVGALVVGLFGLSVPVMFDYLETVCTVAPCQDASLTPEAAELIQAAGVSITVYATLFVAVLTVFALVHLLVAALLIWRRSTDRMALFAAVTLVTFGASTYPSIPQVLAHAYPNMQLPAGVLAFLGDASIMVLLYVFPDGHFVPRWTRWLVLLWTLAWAPSHFLPGGPLDLGALPLPLRTLAFAVGPVPAIAAQIYRYRRTSSLDQRRQTKWVMYGVTVGLGAILAGSIVGVAAPSLATNPFVNLLGGALIALFMLGIPLSIGFAVLRYRLWDVDPLINRTLVWGGLAIVITLVYVAVVVGIGDLVGTAGQPNLVLSLVATVVLALVFQPVRERMQQLANRLVYGQRASPYDVLANFSQRLADALSVEDVLPRMAEAAARGVGGMRGRVRVYVPGGIDQAVAWPAGAVGETFARTVPVLHHGQLVGEIAIAKPAHDAMTPTDEKLLMDLALQAGPALMNVRLDLELQARLLELQASRQRIVAAQDQERRRLERDLHDGAQQQLVALAVNVRVAQELLETDLHQTRELLDDVGAQANDALETLRDLARGIFPAVLADRGLGAALQAYLAKSQAGVSFHIAESLTFTRFEPQAEAAVYFCCLEALQNRAKYAPGSTAGVHLELENSWLTFRVSDQGPGFERTAATAGTGLAGMADRLAAVGGTLEVRSAPGHGTVVTGRLPVDAVARTPGLGGINRGVDVAPPAYMRD